MAISDDEKDKGVTKGDGFVNIIATLGQNNGAEFYTAWAEDVKYVTEDNYTDVIGDDSSVTSYSEFKDKYRKGSVQEALDTINADITSINNTITEIEDTEISTINNYIYSLQTKVSDLEDNIGDLIKVKTVTIKASNWTSSNAYFYTPTDNTLVIVRPTEGCSEDMYDAIARANFEIGYYNDNTELGLVSRSLLPTIDITLDFIEIPLSTSS